MKKKPYIQPCIKCLKITEEDLLNVSGTNFEESPSIPFGETHESGGSGTVLGKGNNSFADDSTPSNVIDWDD